MIKVSPELLYAIPPRIQDLYGDKAMGRLIAILSCSLPLCAYAQEQIPPAQTEFIVLRTDRVDVPVGGTTHLNCSIVGSGDAAQISCESQTSGCESGSSENSPYGSSPCKLGAGLGSALGTRASVYHLALVVGSNHVGYVVSCAGGGLIRKGCQPLATGQVFKGAVHGDKLSLVVDSKVRNYTVETSAYIGPLTRPSQSETASPTLHEPSTEPSVELAVEKSEKPESGPGWQADQAVESSAQAAKFRVTEVRTDEPTDWCTDRCSQVRFTVSGYTDSTEYIADCRETLVYESAPGRAHYTLVCPTLHAGYDYTVKLADHDLCFPRDQSNENDPYKKGALTACYGIKQESSRKKK